MASKKLNDRTTDQRPPSLIGRLLHEISWEGNARHYRTGGRGRENVLTAEVFLALDFLPRSAFFGRVLQTAVGAADTVKRLSRELEQLTFSFLPGDILLSRKNPTLAVQPDVLIESESVRCLIEAKRIKHGTFQPQQLAREYLAVVQHAIDGGTQQFPLLLLVLPSNPPVPVRKHGSLQISEAIIAHLESVYSRCEHDLPPVATLVQNIASVVSYVTWPDVGESIAAASNEFASGDASVDAAVTRIADAALCAMKWHS